MHRKREYCETLGVSADADEETVKRAYRKLVLEYHPDRPNNKGREIEASTMFNKINEAYEGLQNNSQTMNIFKNQFKSQEIRSSVEQFIFTTGKNTSFSFGSATNSKEFSFTASNPSIKTQDTTKVDTTSTAKKNPKNGQSLQTILKIAFDESLIGCSNNIEYKLSKLCVFCN
jgi:molecular chaperone DnaJ